MNELEYIKKYGDAGTFLFNKKGKRLPWSKTYDNIVGRCTDPKHNRYESYGGKGIKCLVTLNELKDLYIRDRAWEMIQPSIDRIDGSKDYIKDNLQWVEMSFNRVKKNPKINPHDKTICIRLSIDDKELLINNAKLEGVSLSKFLVTAGLIKAKIIIGGR